MGYKLKRILIYPDGVTEKQVYPAGWQPGPNTVAYYPLDTNLNDYSGNNNDLMATNVTITTYNGVSCGYWNGNAYANNNNVQRGATRTGIAWVYTSSNGVMGVICSGGNYRGDVVGVGVGGGKGYITDRETRNTYGTTNVLNGWHMLAFTTNNGDTILYVDGTQESTDNFSRTDMANGHGVGIGAKYYYPGQSGESYSEKYTGYISGVVCENKVRTAQEVADYYNQTKSNYGL